VTGVVPDVSESAQRTQPIETSIAVVDHRAADDRLALQRLLTAMSDFMRPYSSAAISPRA
jgi:hypothetical protein